MIRHLYTIGKPLQRNGAIVIMAALSLLVLVAYLAFSVDVGYIAVTQSELQNAADAAAMSATRMLPDREAAITAATTWAGKNIAAGKPVPVVAAEDVEIGIWDDDTASFNGLDQDSSVTPNAVKVTCRLDSERENPLSLFFAPILGTKYANLAASAIGQNRGGSCGGIMALEKIYLNDRQVGRASYTDSYDSTQGDYHSQTPGDNGDICTNGHLTLNGNSYVNGDARWWEQANDPNADESQVSGVFASFVDPIDFPPIDPGHATTLNDNWRIGVSDSGFPVLNAGHFELGMSGNRDSISLSPGTYYFTSMTVGGYSRVTVTGPTYIYVQGEIDLKWGGIDNITRKPVNLQIYPMGLDTYFYLPFFGELHASIYSTTAHIYLDEKNEPVNLEFFGKMVGQKIRVWDTALHVDESISFGGLKSGGEQIGKTGVSLVQ